MYVEESNREPYEGERVLELDESSLRTRPGSVQLSPQSKFLRDQIYSIYGAQKEAMPPVEAKKYTGEELELYEALLSAIG